MNISSIIVRVDKKYWKDIKISLDEIDGVEVHIFDEENALAIVTITADSAAYEIEKLGQIERIVGVIGANMHYSYSEESQDRLSDEEILAHIEKIEDAKEIRYKGSVNNWI